MTEDDRNAQIGAAVKEYQAAKIELAHIEQKIDKVFLAYREAGSTMDGQRGTIQEPTLVAGKIKFGWGMSKTSATDLLNETDLTALILERDIARQRLQVAKDIMNNLGITGMS